MVENKEGLITALIMGVAFLIIGVIIAFVLVSNVADIEGDVAGLASASTSQSILTESTATLSPVGEGITSSSGTANNDSWLEFDGVNDKINSNFPINSSNITACVWFKSKNLSRSEDLIGQKRPTNGNRSWFLVKTSGNQYGFGVYNETDNSGKSASTTATSIINNWEHICGTFNSTDVLIYFDGTLNNTASYNGIIRKNTITFSIGDFGHSSYDGFGGIDEVRIYNQSLTSSQISEIYNSGRIANSSLPSDGLVLWYSFNSGTGTTVFDKSGQGNNGE